MLGVNTTMEQTLNQASPAQSVRLLKVCSSWFAPSEMASPYLTGPHRFIYCELILFTLGDPAPAASCSQGLQGWIVPPRNLLF